MKLKIKRCASSLFILVAGFSILFTSCNRFLDVQPVGELPGDKLLRNAEGFESALYGVYASLNTNSLYGRNLSHDLTDVLAQYYVSPSNTVFERIRAYDYKHSDVESLVNAVWGSMYTNIANVNNILIHLDKMDESSMRHYRLYKGEALGLRAFMHFDLLRLFTEDIKLNPDAAGIPYSVKFELRPSAFSKAAQVYDYIIADLLEAEKLLAADVEYVTIPKVVRSDGFLNDRETHFNLYAAQATLARIYLTKGDLPNAAIYAKKVLDADVFELMDKGQFANNLPKGTLYPTETIFGIYSTTHFATVKQRFYDTQSFFSYNVRTDLLNTYKQEQEPIDYRITSFFREIPFGSDTLTRFDRLVDPFQVSGQPYLRPAGRIDGINLIRIPEMHYILAEALMQTDLSKAEGYFDAVLNSRGLNSLSARQSPTPLTLERITRERYKELIGEGQTFYNMKRLNLPITINEGGVIQPSKAVYVWPIPVDEYEHNF